MVKQCEESISAKTEAMEQIKLLLEEAQQELLLTKNQVGYLAAHYIFLVVRGVMFPTRVPEYSYLFCFRSLPQSSC